MIKKHTNITIYMRLALLKTWSLCVEVAFRSVETWENCEVLEWELSEV